MLKKIMDKKYFIAVGIFCLFIFLLLLKVFIFPSVREDFIGYIKKQGYANSNDGYLYYKQVSDNDLDTYGNMVQNSQESTYELNYFDTIKYQLVKDKRTYVAGIEFFLLEEYDYVKNVLTFNYRGVLGNDSSFIFSGEYSVSARDEKFTCDKEYSYGYDASSSDELICNNVRYEVDAFYLEALDAIRNSKLVDEIGKVKK